MRLQPLRVWQAVHLHLHIPLDNPVPDTRDVSLQRFAADGGERKGRPGVGGCEEGGAFVEAIADGGNGFGEGGEEPVELSGLWES